MSRNLRWIAKSSLVLLSVALGCAPGWSEQAQAQSAVGRSIKPTGKSKKTKSGGQRGVVPAGSTPESAPAASVGPYYALVIGINDYKSPLPKLKTAVYDAREVAKLLEHQYGFVAPKLLLNPGRKDIMLALNQYHQLPANSNLLIYYAGHGQSDQKAKKAYWLPADADPVVDVNWISAGTISEEISRIPAQHVLVISDSCYSGELTRDVSLLRGLPSLIITPREREAYFSRMLESPSRTLMASGRDEPVADDGSEGHSRFAYVLLASLQQIDDDKFTAAYLFENFVQQAVGGGTGSVQVPQYSPILNSGHQWGDFVFSRKGPRPPIDRPRVGLSVATPGTDLAGTGPIPKYSSTNDANRSSVDSAEADSAAIAEVLRRYQQAYDMRDTPALWAVWPDARTDIRQRIDVAFKNASSIRMTLTAGTPVFAPDKQSATVKAQISHWFVSKDGSQQPPHIGDTSFTLRKINGAWVIRDVQ